MGPLLLIMSVCSTLGAVYATDVQSTTPSPQIANFDEIFGVNPALGIAPPKPYKLLSYTAFALGAPVPGAVAIQPSSGQNAVFAPYLLVDTLAQPNITSVYDGSKVASFDVKSIAGGCYASTQSGAILPAISCTIRYTGIKAATGGAEVFHDQVFEVKSVSSLGLALAAEKVQKTTFPSAFAGLSSLKPKVLTAALPKVGDLSAKMSFDDFIYTANVRK